MNDKSIQVKSTGQISHLFGCLTFNKHTIQCSLWDDQQVQSKDGLLGIYFMGN